MPWLGDREIGGLGISFLGFRISLLYLGSDILKLKGSLWTLGLWQELDLIALVLWPRTTLANPLTLGHLNLLALVTSLVRPNGDLSRRNKGQDGRRLLKGGWCKGNGRRECNWNFTDFCRVENVLSLPPLKSNRDSCPVECLCPHFLAVVPVDLCQLLCQTNLGLLHPKVIGCLLRSLYHFLGCPSSLLGLF